MRAAHTHTWKTTALALGLGIALSGCKDTTESTPVGPSLAMGGGQACSFNSVKQDVRNYFPGSGSASSEKLALAIVASLETHCQAGASAAYTTASYSLFKMFETGLEGDLPDGDLGNASTGNAILQAILTMASPSAAEPDLFDPCDALGPPPGPAPAQPTCLAWEGWPVAPDFTLALSGPANMFAVIGPAGLGTVLLTSDDPICSGPAAPCDDVTTGMDPETWGFAPEPPSTTWSDVQGGKTSLFWGYPIAATGPTGETPLSLAGAFFASSMPFFADFPADHQLEITFCTVEDPAAGLIASIAHDESATEPGTMIGSWCLPGTHSSLSSGGLFGTLASLVRSAVTVRPLFAALHAGSPTGGIGGFGSELYAFETSPTGMLDVLNSPIRDATTGGQLVGADGQPLQVRARTSTSTPANPTGIEKVVLEFVLGNNNGTIPSGNALISLDPTNQDVVCANTSPLPAWHGSTPPPPNICRTRTGADQTAGAGIAVFAGIASTKNGGFVATIREVGSTSLFTFNDVSGGQFNVNPN